MSTSRHPVADVLIVGAGYAGLACAHRLAGRAKVMVVAPEKHFVDRIRLHQFATGGWSEDRVAPPLSSVLPAETSFVQGRVVAVAPGGVTLETGRQIEADHVVVAAGSGVGGGVSNLESSRRVRREFGSLPDGARVRINGAGHTGIELAAEMAGCRRDLTVELVDPLGPGPRLGSTARQKVLDHLYRAGVIVADSPSSSDAQLTVDCTGFATPRIVGLAAPDPTLSFGAGLWAAGDIAATGHRWSCAAAEPMGAHVADNILRQALGRQPVELDFGFAVQCLSLGRARGVVQPVTARDEPRSFVVSGRPAALTKELVSRMARRVATGGARRYRWPSGPALRPTGARAGEGSAGPVD